MTLIIVNIMWDYNINRTHHSLHSVIKQLLCARHLPGVEKCSTEQTDTLPILMLIVSWPKLISSVGTGF